MMFMEKFDFGYQLGVGLVQLGRSAGVRVIAFPLSRVKFRVPKGRPRVSFGRILQMKKSVRKNLRPHRVMRWKAPSRKTIKRFTNKTVFHDC